MHLWATKHDSKPYITVYIDDIVNNEWIILFNMEYSMVHVALPREETSEKGRMSMINPIVIPKYKYIIHSQVELSQISSTKP